MKLIKTLALLLATATTWAQSLSVEDIVNRANLTAYYQGKDGRAQVHMLITDSQGRQRERRFTILRRDQADTDNLEGNAYKSDQQMYVHFQRPADVNKMSFLVWKHLQEDDDRWLYLPALDLVKRIAAADKRTSFVGSDYYYEDVSGRAIDADHHELIDTTDDYYILKNTPKDPASVEFSHYIVHVHKGTFIPVQTEYFDNNGEKYRIAKAHKVEKVGSYPTVIQASMQDLRSGSTTVMSYTQVNYNINLPDEIFSERFLRRAPIKYLR
ncbi:MAG: outer membrane lipoprotein-sorting protein [Candidatus Pelagadaptatus aseana]|uniref:outer membrane lipoprotein-sorting protein n=1 Tax=Candidatus Pelagadaptatus aseana TaxID=3120508 RepID=UPI0039B15669